MGLVLIAEVFQSGEHWIGSGLSQAAHGGLLQRFRQLLQQVQIAGDAFALGDALQDLQHPLGAHPAGEAFAAALVPDEVHEVAGGVHHAGVLVHDDEAAGTDDGAQRRQGLIVHRGVQVLPGEAAAGGAAGLDSLEALASGDAAADDVENVAQGDTHRHFHETGVVDLA